MRLSEPVPQAGQVAGNAVVVGGQFGQHFRDIVGVGLRHVGGAKPVQGAQDPEVGEIVLPPGKAEQAEPVADRQRVEVERISLVIGDRHRDEPLPVHMAVGAMRFPMMASRSDVLGAAAGDDTRPPRPNSAARGRLVLRSA